MKVCASAVVLAMAASVASGAVQFNKNFMAVGANDRNRIAFNGFDTAPLPKNLLAAVGMDQSSSLPCMYSASAAMGTSTIMLAIDKCLDQASIDMIEQWVDQIKSFLSTEGLKFETTLVDGRCAERSEKEKSGRGTDLLADGTDYRLSTAVLPGEIERISAFAKFGRVLQSIDFAGIDVGVKPIAVVSFVNNELSYDYVQHMETTLKIDLKYSFSICQEGENCEGLFENCVHLSEMVDVFMYNPFTITHSWECSSVINGGVPVTVVDGEGHRQCYCSCPAGSVAQFDEAYQSYSCVVNEPDVCPCTWSNQPYKLENEVQLETCEFTDFATKHNLPVPFPTDNYVSDLRTNDKDATDDLKNGPRVDVVVTRLHSTIYNYEVLNEAHQLANSGEPLPESIPETENGLLNLFGVGELSVHEKFASTHDPSEPSHYTWKDYLVHRQEKIDDISLTSYGKYELAVKAVDYLGEDFAAQCVGCVATVDKFRPKAKDTCPTNFCDKSTSLCHDNVEAATAELTTEYVAKANKLVEDFYKFQETSYNDACSSKPSDRCDEEVFQYKDFFEQDYSTHYQSFHDGKKCFDPEQMKMDFIAKELPKTNPLVEGYGGCNQHDTPVTSFQCTRCCQYGVKLQEWWVDYTCGHEYDIARCQGDYGQSCDTQQCLVLFGDTLATVSASIKSDVVIESDKVLAGISNEGFQSVTQIHKALQCTKFGGDDGECKFASTVAQLVDVKVENKFGSETETYVFWRYKIKGDDQGWRLFDPLDADAVPHTFNEPKTKIILEAWTACGIARKFYFYVHLHVHSPIKVCDVFDKMWYQTSESRAEISSALGAFPGSDFAELTFDYQPNVGLQFSRNDLQMHVTGVRCELAFTDKAPAEIINVQADSPEIIQRFAVDLQEFKTTTEITRFSVSCVFTYARHDGSSTTQTCGRSFEIADSTGPLIDPTHGDCTWEDCAGQAKPGPGEACGGLIVRSHATATYVDDWTKSDNECCDGCGMKSECVSIFDLPEITSPIKRCVPQLSTGEYGEPYGAYSYDSGYYGNAVALMSNAVSNHPTAAAATALLAASAMVAVVALVVVRRRRHTQKETIIEDAYYPLLH